MQSRSSSSFSPKKSLCSVTPAPPQPSFLRSRMQSMPRRRHTRRAVPRLPSSHSSIHAVSLQTFPFSGHNSLVGHCITDDAAIAAAVFGAPAVPYVIPCTILRRIRMFREGLSPNSQPAETSASASIVASLLSERSRLAIGNFILGTSPEGSTRP